MTHLGGARHRRERDGPEGVSHQAQRQLLLLERSDFEDVFENPAHVLGPAKRQVDVLAGWRRRQLAAQSLEQAIDAGERIAKIMHEERGEIVLQCFE